MFKDEESAKLRKNVELGFVKDGEKESRQDRIDESVEKARQKELIREFGETKEAQTLFGPGVLTKKSA